MQRSRPQQKSEKIPRMATQSIQLPVQAADVRNKKGSALEAHHTRMCHHKKLS